MKKRNLFLTLGLSLTLGVGVAAGLGASRVEAKETHAATGDYKIAGSFTSWASNAVEMTDNGDGTFSYTRDFVHGDEFKVIDKDAANWYGYHNVTGTGYTYFSGEEGQNIVCRAAGNYTINFKVSDKSFVIVDNSANTYSYVLTAWSDYTCAYIYNSDSDKFSGWAETPSVNDVGGQKVATGSKVKFGGNDYYGIYRISDRYLTLNGYSHLILKRDGDVFGTYDNQTDTFDLNGTQKVYSSINAGTRPVLDSSSDLYKALTVYFELYNSGICSMGKASAAAFKAYLDSESISASQRNILSECLWDGYTYQEAYNKIEWMITNSPSPANNEILSRENNNYEFIIIAIVSTLLVGAGAFFVIRRRKETN